MSDSLLDNLRPAKTKHSIDEVVFQIGLHQMTQLEGAGDLEKYHHDIKNELPKHDVIKTGDFAINFEQQPLIQAPKTIDTGYRFAKFNDKAEIIEALECNNNNNRPYISYNNLDYKGWKKTSGRALEFIKKVSDSQKNLIATNIILHYIDRLYWDSTEPFPTWDIFNPESKFTPKIFAEKDGLQDVWSYQLSYSSADKINTTKGTNISLQIEKNIQLQKYRATISIPLSINFIEPINLYEAINSNGEYKMNELFTSLNLQNKEILSDILTEYVKIKIGLEKNE